MDAGVSGAHASQALNGVFILNTRALDVDVPLCILIGVTARSSFVTLSILVKFHWHRRANRSTDFNVILSFSHGDNAYLLETTQIGGIARPTVAPIIGYFQAFSLILFPYSTRTTVWRPASSKLLYPASLTIRGLMIKLLISGRDCFGLFGQICSPIPAACENDDEDRVLPYRLYVMPSRQLSADSERPLSLASS
jgi:hypothetical protein